MGFTESSTPVTSSDGNDREFGKDDGAANGSCDFLCALDAETNMAIKVTDSNESLEAGTLTSTSLLLHRHDFHNLVLELGEEGVDNLVLLDGERKEVDFFHRLDLAVLHETTELGDGGPMENSYQ